MGIASVCRIRGSWKANLPATYSQRTIKLSYRVIVTSVNDGPQVIALGAAAAGLPVLGSQYSIGNEGTVYMYCLDVDFEQSSRADGLEWIYTCTFGELSYETVTGIQQPNPTLRPSKYWIEWLSYTRAADMAVDWTSQAEVSCVNSAKQPFDPPNEIERNHIVHVIERNEGAPSTSYDDIVNNANTYVGHVNSLDVELDNGHEIEAGCGLMLPMGVSPEQSEYNVQFWTVTYRIAENPETWAVAPLDHGHMYLSAGKLVPFLDKNNDIKFEGGNLNGVDGGKLADGTAGVFLDGQSGRLGPYWFNYKADFNSLSL